MSQYLSLASVSPQPTAMSMVARPLTTHAGMSWPPYYVHAAGVVHDGNRP